MQRNLLILLVYICSWVATYLFVGLLYIVTPDITDDVLNQLAQIAFGLSGFLLMVGIFYKYVFQQSKQFKNNWKHYLGISLLTFVLLFAAAYISQAILDTIGVSGQSENQEGINSLFDNISTVNLVLLILGITVFTPVVEEFTFRKGVYGILGQLHILFVKKVNPDADTSAGSIHFKIASFVAIVGSAFAFGYLHVMLAGDLQFLLPYVSAGLVLGFMYHLSDRNIYPVIIGHILWNTFSVVLMLIYG